MAFNKVVTGNLRLRSIRTCRISLISNSRSIHEPRTGMIRAEYNSLPPAVRLLYSPLQHIPWPGVYCQYLEAGFRPVHKPYVPTEAERAAWPKTVDEAVTSLLAGMDDADKARVRDTKKEDLILFHHGWGTGIRNDLGLWRGNTNLMADCHTEVPDHASMVIIKAVWQKLQKP